MRPARHAVWEGVVRHRRSGDVEHSFSYRVCMIGIDLAHLDTAFDGRWFWSVGRRNLASFRREDHLGDPSIPLETAVRDLVEERTGRRPGGPIELLTHPRYWGYGFNPVSFYYCRDAAGERVETIVAEVNNTPWGEQHAYVLGGDGDLARTPGRHRWRFRKAFHVSPFLDLDHDYDWRFTDPGHALAVHMENLQGGEKCFDATLTLRRRPWTGRSLAAALLRYPFMTGQVIAAIYWQALRLRLKGAPFFPHPSKRAAPAPGTETA